jgi:4-hydroxybenzoate polyprenyltransferase
MAFNRVVDRRFDALNPRTAERHLPSGKVSLPTAWFMIILGIIIFLIASACINRLALALSPIALIVILGYSFTKRFTSLSHFVLGLALSLAPLGAWVAVRGELFSLVPWCLALAVLCWVAGFDMIYAMQDHQFDAKTGLHSMVVAIGPQRCLQLVRTLHLLMFVLLIIVGLISELKWPYFVGLSVVLASLTWEQWLMRHGEQRNLQKAFLQANGIASFGYLAAVILQTLYTHS